MLCIQSKKRRVTLFSSVSAAAENVTVNTVTATDACSALPKILSIAGAANQYRHKNRSRAISIQLSADFDLEQDHVPAGFLLADMTKADSHRHYSALTNNFSYSAKHITWYVV